MAVSKILMTLQYPSLVIGRKLYISYESRILNTNIIIIINIIINILFWIQLWSVSKRLLCSIFHREWSDRF